MASLPKEFETFVVNYNMSPGTWDIEKTIAMCVQEEDRLKASHDGTLNYVKDHKNTNYNQTTKVLLQSHKEKFPINISVSNSLSQWTKTLVSTVRRPGITRKTVMFG